MKSNVMENEVRDEAMERIFVEKEMEREVKWLLSLHADEGWHWTGTKTALAGLLYHVFSRGTLYDSSGRLLSFKSIVRQVFENLHLSVPKNPTSFALRAYICKGIKQLPLLESYRYAMFEKNCKNPLAVFLRQEK